MKMLLKSDWLLAFSSILTLLLFFASCNSDDSGLGATYGVVLKGGSLKGDPKSDLGATIEGEYELKFINEAGVEIAIDPEQGRVNIIYLKPGGGPGGIGKVSVECGCSGGTGTCGESTVVNDNGSVTIDCTTSDCTGSCKKLITISRSISFIHKQ